MNLLNVSSSFLCLHDQSFLFLKVFCQWCCKNQLKWFDLRTSKRNTCIFFSSMKKKQKCKERLHLFPFHSLNNCLSTVKIRWSIHLQRKQHFIRFRICHISNLHNRIKFIFSLSIQIDFYTQVLNTLNLDNNQIGVQGAKDLFDALRENRVSRIFSSSTQKTHSDFFTQILNELNLRLNQIAAERAKHLFDALRVNRVSPIFCSSTQKTHSDFLTQTLNTLHLTGNKIGDRGAKHLSDALRENRVSRIFSSSTQKTHSDVFTDT